MGKCLQRNYRCMLKVTQIPSFANLSVLLSSLCVFLLQPHTHTRAHTHSSTYVSCTNTCMHTLSCTFSISYSLSLSLFPSVERVCIWEEAYVKIIVIYSESHGCPFPIPTNTPHLTYAHVYIN